MKKVIVITTLCLAPLFFLPVTQNFYDTNKWMLIAAGAIVTLIFWAIKLLQVKKPLRIPLPWTAIGFGGLTIASLIGLLVASTNKTEALLAPLGPITFFSLTILTIAGSQMTKQEKVRLRWGLYAATAILGLIAIYQSLGLGKLILPQIPYLTDPLWTPAGSVTTAIALFVITLSLLIPDTIASVTKGKEYGSTAFLIISLLIITAGASLTVFPFIPHIASMLPFDVGMVAASQIFKYPLSAAFGVGAENFLWAYTMNRPAILTAAFGTNADFFLHILTVYGVTGLVGAVLLVGSLVTGKKTEWLFATKLLCIADLLIVPPTIPLLANIAIVLILAHGDTPPPKPVTGWPWLRIMAGILLVVTSAVSLYFLARAYAAEVYFFQSLRAAAANDGTSTYNRQIAALGANTFISRYHLSYSQTSMALANSIAGMDTKTDKDTQLVGQLLQQSIKEAKIAVTLNTRNVAAWENLGLTYQTIIPVASEAAGWALSAYQTSVALDPNNPTLFVNIGSVLVAQKQYDSAIAAFQRAIQLSPSYANAYYNLAYAYKLKGDTVNQAKILTETLKLVAPASSDYYKIKNELDALEKK